MFLEGPILFVDKPMNLDNVEVRVVIRSGSILVHVVNFHPSSYASAEEFGSKESFVLEPASGKAERASKRTGVVLQRGGIELDSLP